MKDVYSQINHDKPRCTVLNFEKCGRQGGEERARCC
jgi:hypothetical protein